ncbi:MULTISPECIES: membrane protein [unclassified Butyrivibrio]|uniref:membrane protein n=1 Tax=unclassified Butyrivibrio TaxID=2639466 RepID=UPI0004260CD0|nr:MULTISPECIES: membrane protein [unclassified Butyrivibrio]
MSNFERKFGKYAIKNLTIVLIICYIVGYILMFAPSGYGILEYMTLNPYAILHGQVWRLVTWVIVPPNYSNLFFVLVMLYFYYSIGTTMEKVWGEYRYNVYIFTGLLLMIAASFLYFAYVMIFRGGSTASSQVLYDFMQDASLTFNTSLINMSILLAFAATFPDNMVLFMFIIPLKMKWLGIAYGCLLAFQAVQAIIYKQFDEFFAIAASFLTFATFWFSGGKLMHLRPKEVKRRNDFKRSVKITPPGITRHKCAVCGRSENDDPTLEFRFCSKCNGNYEYCQEHLFTHTHVK